ncbi:MAG: LytTR family transcriptional regulator [Notoacmeibacter sp.]|nr:LytTR family transcriptional regulator [Notoacmeibacter sp.]
MSRRGAFSAQFRQIVLDPIYVSTTVVVTLVFGFVSAFQTYLITSLQARIVYWAIVCLATLVVYATSSALLHAWNPAFLKRRHPVYSEILAALIVSFILAPPARLLLGQFAGIPVTYGDMAFTWLKYLSVCPLIVGVASIVRFREARNLPGNAGTDVASGALPEPQGPMPEEPADVDGTPSGEPGPSPHAPFYIEAEDHYVKLVFADIVDIKRNSLRKEARQWQGLGLQVHRSYWVRRDQIADHERNGRQLLIRLKSGTRIPVGRSYEKDVLDLVRRS